MRAALYPLQVLLVGLAGWANRRQQHVIEYLIEENQSVVQLWKSGGPPEASGAAANHIVSGLSSTGFDPAY
jgi:hypothetical protein